VSAKFNATPVVMPSAPARGLQPEGMGSQKDDHAGDHGVDQPHRSLGRHIADQGRKVIHPAVTMAPCSSSWWLGMNYHSSSRASSR
jgi:hypothetical protein